MEPQLHLWVLSDLHLKNPEDSKSQILLKFLKSLYYGERPITHLGLLGDIFDLWIGGHSVFVERWSEHLSYIKRLISEKKVELIYFEGNHDVHIAPYWQKRLGAQVFTEPATLFLNPYKIHFEHGDLINQEDINYLKYRSIIRSRPLKLLGLNLPGLFWDQLGNYLSQKSGKQSRQKRADKIDQLRLMIRMYSDKLAQAPDAPDFIFTGHFHIKDEYEINLSGKKVRSINLGSWLGEQTQVYYLTNDSGYFIDLI
jgi:UDP-2,3-diacylglucosamine hydrolase